MGKLSWSLVFILAGCATTPPDMEAVPETDHYTLAVVSHCPEGEVGCARLTATLLNKQFGGERKLTGTTSMVKCADGITPCHLGFYDLKAPHLSVRAYPDGSLEIHSYDVIDLSQHGTWRRQE